MNLRCPHCRSTLNLPDALAGQSTICPQCGGPLTAPLAAAAPPREAPAAPDREQEPSPPPVRDDYPHHLSLYLQLMAVKWVPPIGIALLFVLLFFPWVGLYAGGSMLARQSGVGVAFGFMGRHAQGFLEGLDPGFAFLPLLYFFLILLGVVQVAIVAAASFAPEDYQPHLPKAVKTIVAWRSFLLGAVCLLGFLFLLPNVFVNFPFESMMEENAGKVYEACLQAAKDLDVDRASLLTNAFLGRRSWYAVVLLVNLLAALGSLGDFWLARRGSRPPPRIDAAW